MGMWHDPFLEFNGIHNLISLNLKLKKNTIIILLKNEKILYKIAYLQ